MRIRGLHLAAAAAVTLLLTACGGGDADTADAPANVAATTSAAPATGASVPTDGTEAAADEPISVVDGWAKATAGTEETSMTAVFGTLTNNTDADRTIVSAVTTASPRAELHEMATVDGAMIMREVAGGIMIPAGGSTTLEPGGLHVMVMDATEELAPGDEVDVVLTFDDDSTLEFTALAKEFAGANEEYESDGGTGSMEMDHGNMDHGTSGAEDHSGHGTESSSMSHG